jgi:hypothetical protein
VIDILPDGVVNMGGMDLKNIRPDSASTTASASKTVIPIRITPSRAVTVNAAAPNRATLSLILARL